MKQVKYAGKWKATVPLRDEPRTLIVSGVPYSPTARSSSTPLDAGSTARKDSPAYTGSKMKGIGAMHKSNLVPVFSDEEAQDIAKMRRN